MKTEKIQSNFIPLHSFLYDNIYVKRHCREEHLHLSCKGEISPEFHLLPWHQRDPPELLEGVTLFQLQGCAAQAVCPSFLQQFPSPLPPLKIICLHGSRQQKPAYERK